MISGNPLYQFLIKKAEKELIGHKRLFQQKNYLIKKIVDIRGLGSFCVIDHENYSYNINVIVQAKDEVNEKVYLCVPFKFGCERDINRVEELRECDIEEGSISFVKPELLEKIKMTIKINRPQLRFPEFDEEWEEKKLDDCLNYIQPNKYIVKTTDYDEKFKTPVLTAGKSFILGYTNESDNIFSQLPVIIFDDFTTATQFVNFPFKVKSSAMKILKKKNDTSLYFIFNAIKNIKFEVAGHGRQWISKYSQLIIKVPILEEQQKIAEFLETADNYLENLRQQKEKLEQYKKSLTQKIFSQEIRFRDDNGREFPRWNKKRLSFFSDIYDGTHQTPKYVQRGIKFVSVENIANLSMTNKYITNLMYEINFKQKPAIDDILMTRIGDIGTSALILTDEKFAYYVSLALIKCKLITNSHFLNQSIKATFFQKQLWKKTIHVAFPKKINLGDIGNCLIEVPTELEEQQKIAEFLETADQLIENKQTQINLTEKWKKGLMQRMFC